MWKNTLSLGALIVWGVMVAAGVLCFVGAAKAEDFWGSVLFAVVGVAFIAITTLRFYSWWNWEKNFVFKTGQGGRIAVANEVKKYWSPKALKQVQDAILFTRIWWQREYFDGGAELIDTVLKDQMITIVGSPYTALGDKRRGSTNGATCVLVWQKDEPFTILYSITCHETGHVCLNGLGILNEGESHHELMRIKNFPY